MRWWPRFYCATLYTKTNRYHNIVVVVVVDVVISHFPDCTHHRMVVIAVYVT